MSYIQKPSGAESEFLDNFKLLSTSDWTTLNGLPSSDVFGWNLAGISDFDGLNYIGDEDLIEVGSLTAANNHLGDSVFCDFDGINDLIHATGTVFDTINESLSWCGWVNFGLKGSAETIVSKLSVINADKSFSFMHDSSLEQFDFDVYTDGAGTSVSLTAESSNYLDGKLHHVGIFYDQANTAMGIIVDGKIIAFVVDSSLSVRNNSSGTDLTIGGQDGSGTPASFFLGQISDHSYYKGVLTFDQFRQIYVTGSLELAFKNQNGRVKITGENGCLGYIEKRLTSDLVASIGGFFTVFDLHTYIKGEYELGYVLNGSIRYSTNGYMYSRVVDSSIAIIKNLQSPDIGIGFDGVAPNTPIIGSNCANSTNLSLTENKQLILQYRAYTGTGSPHAVTKGTRIYWKLLDY